MSEETRVRMRAELRPDDGHAWVELTLGLVDALAPEDSDDPVTWPAWSVLRPHVECILGMPNARASRSRPAG